MTRGKASWDAGDCALILIDYQPEMFKAIGSSDPEMVEKNICALWTEICLAFFVVEALRDGYEVSFVADVVA